MMYLNELENCLLEGGKSIVISGFLLDFSVGSIPLTQIEYKRMINKISVIVENSSLSYLDLDAYLSLKYTENREINNYFIF